VYHKIATYLVLTTALLSGCASSRVVAPAADIADAVAAFQADLSQFQQSSREVQANEAALAARNDSSRAIYMSSLEQIETRRALLDTNSFAEMLEILQARANAHVAEALNPKAGPAAPASASMPVGKLGSVASITKKIARPPKSDAELKFLVDFIKKTNEDLAALD
jgi:hypothetical protein